MRSARTLYFCLSLAYRTVWQSMADIAVQASKLIGKGLHRFSESMEWPIWPSPGIVCPMPMDCAPNRRWPTSCSLAIFQRSSYHRSGSNSTKNKKWNEFKSAKFSHMIYCAFYPKLFQFAEMINVLDTSQAVLGQIQRFQQLVVLQILNFLDAILR